MSKFKNLPLRTGVGVVLLNNENPDLDLLNEKAFESLGLIEENSFVINTNNL